MFSDVHHAAEAPAEVPFRHVNRVNAEPGDITSPPKGHDARVVGDEPTIVVDFFGASNYAEEG